MSVTCGVPRLRRWMSRSGTRDNARDAYGGAGRPAAGSARQADRGRTAAAAATSAGPAMGAVTSAVLLNRFNILRRSVPWGVACRPSEGWVPTGTRGALR